MYDAAIFDNISTLITATYHYDTETNFIGCPASRIPHLSCWSALFVCPTDDRSGRDCLETVYIMCTTLILSPLAAHIASAFTAPFAEKKRHRTPLALAKYGIDDKRNVINSSLQMSTREVNGINADTADEMALNTAINNDGIIRTNDEMITYNNRCCSNRHPLQRETNQLLPIRTPSPSSRHRRRRIALPLHQLDTQSPQHPPLLPTPKDQIPRLV